MLAPELEKELRRHKEEWNFLQSLAPSHRKRYVDWLNAAKRPQTQQKRLAETIELLNQKQKLGMK